MYRLLIVTEKQAVRDMFAAMEGWETMGFKQPRLRQSTAEALECMEKHHIDAIAIDDSAAFEDLNAFVDEHCPLMLRFPIMDTPEEQLRIVRELDRMLGGLRADHTNGEYDEANALWLSRERLLKNIVCGMIPTRQDVAMKLRMLCCKEREDIPCVLARLGMDMEDPFLTDRWHYGSDRLETALRNFFGTEQDDMRLHVAVVSPQEVRVLCYPLSGDEGLKEAVVYDYIRDTVEQVEHYLGLGMNIMDVRRLPGLSAFAAENLKA